ITANALARLLGKYSIQSQTIRLVGGTTAKGYYRSTFEDAFTAYLSPENDNCRSGSLMSRFVIPTPNAV
ncbi:MAG: DUF3631 domain-containing protein, partial [Xanthobacteraceae bacterium]